MDFQREKHKRSTRFTILTPVRLLGTSVHGQPLVLRPLQTPSQASLLLGQPRHSQLLT